MDQVIDFELDAALFRWIGEVEVGRTVYFSSSAAYPIAHQSGEPYQLSEDDINLAYPELPDALYGWTKLTGEMLANTARKAGHTVTVVRPFSGYGSDQDDCYPFPAILQRALDWNDPFVVWGSGMQVRDFVHVDDIVGAVMEFVAQEVDGPINIGTGRATSMSTLAAMAAAQCGFTPEITPLTDEPEGVLYRVADTYLMSQFYTPKITLEEGIERALRYMESRSF
jgi:nucleoside-diphosphate-sugar epimerase